MTKLSRTNFECLRQADVTRKLCDVTRGQTQLMLIQKSASHPRCVTGFGRYIGVSDGGTSKFCIHLADKLPP